MAPDAPEPPSYTPAPWEKAVGYGAAALVLGLVVYLVVRNEPFADPNLVVFTRIVLGVAVAALGATIPGFLHVDWAVKGVTIRAAGALALFVLAFLFTPAVVPGAQPTADEDRKDVELVVGLATEEPPDELDGPAFHDVVYTGERTDSALHVTHTSDYSRALAEGVEVRHVGLLGEGPFFALPRVGLDIKVVNNSDFPVYLHEAVIEVEASEADETPLLVLSHSEADFGHVGFTNDGWAEPDRVSLWIQLVSPETGERSRRFALPRVEDEEYPSSYWFSMDPVIAAYCDDPAVLRRAEARAATAVKYEDALAAWQTVRQSCRGLAPVRAGVERRA